MTAPPSRCGLDGTRRFADAQQKECLTRERSGDEDARMILDEWPLSGSSIAAFARKHGVNAARLYWWKKRLGTGHDRAAERHGARVTTASPTACRDELASLP
jgi:transposase-like protein